MTFKCLYDQRSSQNSDYENNDDEPSLVIIVDELNDDPLSELGDFVSEMMAAEDDNSWFNEMKNAATHA